MLPISSVQPLSCVWLFVTPWSAAHQVSLSITNSWSLLQLMLIRLVMTSNHLILYRPLLFLPSIFPSIRVFSNESVICMRWPKYWKFSFLPVNIQDWFHLRLIGWISLQWKGLLRVFSKKKKKKSLLQQHSLKAPILWHSAFFMLQPSHAFWLLEKP